MLMNMVLTYVALLLTFINYFKVSHHSRFVML